MNSVPLRKNNFITVKPLRNENHLLLKDYQTRYSNFAKTIGIDTSNHTAHNISWRNIFVCTFIQIFVLIVSVIDIGLLVHEHLNGRGVFFKDIRTLTINIGILCTSIPGIMLVKNQHQLLAVLNWCNSVTSDPQLVMKQIKTIKIGYGLAFWQPTYDTVSTLIFCVLLKTRLLPLTTYNADLITQNWTEYIVMYLIFVAHSFAFWRVSLFALTTYIVLVRFISKQYEVLSQMINEGSGPGSKRSQIEIGQNLNTIGQMHVELLNNLTVFSNLYTMILLINETFCVAVVSIAVTSFLYQPNEINFAIIALMSVIYNLLYPVFGEEISSSAEDFEKAIYYCDWNDMSVRNRKSVALILLMAQKPVGVTSGGFHFSNYTELSQIFKMSYNFMIFIKRRHERHLH